MRGFYCLMKKIIFWGLISFFFFTLKSFAIPNATSHIKQLAFCDDISEWPTYNFYELKDGKKTNNLIGYSVDVLNEISTRTKIPYTLNMVPWTRCLNTVKKNSKESSLILQFSKNTKREKDFILTKSYYTTKSAIFFNKNKYKNGLNIKSLAELKMYKGCGIKGYSYSQYGLKDESLDLQVKTISQVAIKLKGNRCDYFIEKYEVVAGFDKKSTTNVLHDPEIGYEYLTMVPPTPYYMGISRKNPYAIEIETLLNNTIDEMEKDGTLKKLENKWIGN